jgi:hypothetical protein
MVDPTEAETKAKKRKPQKGRRNERDFEQKPKSSGVW